MLRSRIPILAAVGILVGALLGIPSAGAAARGDDADNHSTAKVVQGRQVFLVISTTPSDEGGGPIAAFGSIHAKGHDTVLGPRRDRFGFPNGDLIIRHRPTRTPVERFDPITCYFKFVEVGRWRVTRGTGDYTNAAGRGRYRAAGEGMGRKNAQGQCNQNRPPRVFYVKIRAVGSLSH
jgi:hypothetical protein